MLEIWVIFTFTLTLQFIETQTKFLKKEKKKEKLNFLPKYFQIDSGHNVQTQVKYSYFRRRLLGHFDHRPPED